MQKENIKELIEIYEFNGYWFVDFIWGCYEFDPLNIAMATDKEQALKNAVIYMAVEYMKYSELEDKLNHVLTENHRRAYANRYDNLKEETKDSFFQIEEENKSNE